MLFFVNAPPPFAQVINQVRSLELFVHVHCPAMLRTRTE